MWAGATERTMGEFNWNEICRRERWETILNCAAHFLSLSFCVSLIPTFLLCCAHLFLSLSWPRGPHAAGWMLTVLADVALVRKTSTLGPIESLNTNGRRAKRSTRLALPNIWPGTESESPAAACACSVRPQLGFRVHLYIERRKKWKIHTQIYIYLVGFVSLCVQLTRFTVETVVFSSRVCRESAYVWTRAQTRSPCLRRAPQYVSGAGGRRKNMLQVVSYTEK
jgi:hypothetical protein